jgi:very-short-patch-repair endonuclease
LSELSAPRSGVFRAEHATALGVTRRQLARLTVQGVIERVHPSTYRMTSVAASGTQTLRAALLWAGARSAAAGRSAAAQYRLEGVRAAQPEIVLPRDVRGRTSGMLVSHADPASQMIRTVDGIRTTGVEATLLRLAHLLDAESFEIACEDARRRRLTSIPALRAYLERFGRRGRPGVASTRKLIEELDSTWPSRSALEIKTRRLLVANGLTDFTREFPLHWNGRTYRYDFAFEGRRTIVETNGRRWHDDASDYERDNAKWSVPGCHGYRLLLATWDRVIRHPDQFLSELVTTLAA